MKVIWIASWYPNEVFPFNGDFIQRMAQAVAKHCDIAVLTAVESMRESGVEVQRGEILEIIVYYQAPQNPLLKGYRGWALIKAYFKGWRIIQREFGKADLIHLNVIFPAGLFLIFLLWNSKVPLIITEHWSGFRKRNWGRLRYFHRWISKQIAEKARLILPVSSALAEDMRALGLKGNYQIIPNVVDTHLFKPPPNRKMRNGFKFIHISNLIDKVKNVSEIISMFKVLLQTEKDIELIIVGDGVDKADYVTQVITENMEKNVRFTGQVPYQEVSHLLTQSDCLLLFSNYENLPCVLLEALASGVPVITTETGGMYEWVTPDIGMVIPVQDKNALLDAMKSMINKSGQFDQQFLHREVERRCSVEVIGERLKGIYKEILE